jgi:hypothetical protein
MIFKKTGIFITTAVRAPNPNTLQIIWSNQGARSSVLGWDTVLQAGRSRDRVPMRSLDFFQLT